MSSFGNLLSAEMLIAFERAVIILQIVMEIGILLGLFYQSNSL
jgi:hypothetical protein